MSSTTSISELPPSSVSNENIKLETNDNALQNMVNVPPAVPPANGMQGNMQNNDMMQDQTQITKLVSGIQKASAAGATQLPSRDIPQTTTQITHDNQAQPNFIPEPPPVKEVERQYYIPDHDPQQFLENENRKITKTSALEELYNSINIPILASILFLLFQLPVTKKNFKYLFPFTHNVDGNQNILGYSIYSLIFGLIFYTLITVVNNFK